jgi:hypothetical protein
MTRLAKISISIAALFVLSLGSTDAGAWPFKGKSTMGPGSAQAIAGQMQVRDGKQKLSQIPGLMKGSFGMRVQALGLKIQGNNQQANRMLFGARSKDAAAARRMQAGPGNILKGLFNQGAGNARMAVAPVGAALKNAGDRIKSSDVVVAGEVGAKAALHGLKVGGQKLAQVPGKISAGLKDAMIWGQLYAEAAGQALKGAAKSAKAGIVKAARQEGLSTAAQNRLLGQ